MDAEYVSVGIAKDLIKVILHGKVKSDLILILTTYSTSQYIIMTYSGVSTKLTSWPLATTSNFLSCDSSKLVAGDSSTNVFTQVPTRVSHKL